MKRNISDVLGKRSHKHQPEASALCEEVSSKKQKPGEIKQKPVHWTHGLMVAMNDKQLKVHETDKVVIIKDKYPKAKFHFLLMPTTAIKNIQELSKDHIEILSAMQDEAISHIDRIKDPNSNVKFKIGYHAIPSMSPLHLHIISEDFDSPCLKTKKHWNSFTSEFFRPSSDVIDELKRCGKVNIDTEYYKALLKSDLRCHMCEKKLSNIPKLKEHIILHTST